MSGDRPGASSCEMFRDDLAELSLGTLTGRRRSEVLHHVGSCGPCAASLTRYSTVADALLLLAPEMEPPLGFESRLAQRIDAPSTRRRRRLFRAGMLSAAAIILVIFGVALGARMSPSPTRADQTVGLTEAHFTSHGQTLGEVMISQSSPAWMFMTVDANPPPGPVRCEVVLQGGRVETVGVFTLSHGYGAWGASLRASASDVRSARLVAANGTIVASARFPA